MMLLAFVGPPPKAGMHAAHANDIKTDNRLENLVWASPKENALHFYENRHLPDGRHPRAKLTEDKYEEIRGLLAKGVMGAEIAKRFGISQTHVSRIRHGREHRS